MFCESMKQPFLFDDFEFLPDLAPDKAGKSVVSKLNRLRKQLSPSERDFDFVLAYAARRIKSIAALDPNKKQELVLTCIETCSHTWAEIEEDTQLSLAEVRQIVTELVKADLVYGRKRFGIGGSAKQVLIVSKRKPCSCV